MTPHVVAVLCGPHDNDGSVCFRRVDRGIAVAIEQNIPLIVAGDANGRADVRLFCDRAHEAGVRTIYEAYDRRASTLFDVRSITRLLQFEPDLQDVKRVHLVTDYWHMARATVMLADQLRKRLGGSYAIACENVMDGPEPPPDVFAREHRGLMAYIDGTYDTTSLPHVPYGKPQPFRAVG